MTVIKVRDGTPKTKTSLCVTCRNATIVQGTNLQRLVQCNELGQMIVFPVANCSKYSDKSQPTEYDMQQIAWVVQSRNRGPAGFKGSTPEIEIVPPKEDKWS